METIRAAAAAEMSVAVAPALSYPRAFVQTRARLLLPGHSLQPNSQSRSAPERRCQPPAAVAPNADTARNIHRGHYTNRAATKAQKTQRKQAGTVGSWSRSNLRKGRGKRFTF